jgi:hypothetical protein
MSMNKTTVVSLAPLQKIILRATSMPDMCLGRQSGPHQDVWFVGSYQLSILGIGENGFG